MKIFYAIFVYTCLLNVCVVARGGGGGHGGGGHGGGGHGGGGRGGGGHGFGGRGGGYSGRGYHGSTRSGGFSHVTSSHTYFTYHPPSHIRYTCGSCSMPSTYPVYRQQLPSYVYVYKESGGRYNQLLTGLAIYNLGRASEPTHYSFHGAQYRQSYTPQQEEKCSLQIIDRSHFEETEFPCFMISSFTDNKLNESSIVDITSSKIAVKPDVQTGDPLEVTDNQECVLWHNTTLQKERNQVPCALLKEYAETVKQSPVPVYIWLPTLLIIVLIIYMTCHFVSKYKEKQNVTKEDAPLNSVPVAGYCTNYRYE